MASVDPPQSPPATHLSAKRRLSPQPEDFRKRLRLVGLPDHVPVSILGSIPPAVVASSASIPELETSNADIQATSGPSGAGISSFVHVASSLPIVNENAQDDETASATNMVSGYFELKHRVGDLWIGKLGSHQSSTSLTTFIKFDILTFDLRKGMVVYLSGDLEICHPDEMLICASFGTVRTVPAFRNLVASRQSPTFCFWGTVGHIALGTPHLYLLELQLVGSAGMISVEYPTRKDTPTVAIGDTVEVTGFFCFVDHLRDCLHFVASILLPVPAITENDELADAMGDLAMS